MIQAGLHSLADAAISSSLLASQAQEPPWAAAHDSPPMLRPVQKLFQQPAPLQQQQQSMPHPPQQQAPPPQRALLQLSPAGRTPQQAFMPGSALPPACKRHRTEGASCSMACTMYKQC